MYVRVYTVIECEKIDNLTDPNLRIAVLSRQVGGEIMFSCMQGFGLNGPTHSTCLPTGEWEQPFPTCAGTYLYTKFFNHLFSTFKYNWKRCILLHTRTHTTEFTT